MYCRIYRLIADIRTSLARDPSMTGSQKRELLKLPPPDFCSRTVARQELGPLLPVATVRLLTVLIRFSFIIVTVSQATLIMSRKSEKELTGNLAQSFLASN